jgi:hypothetical protein
MKQPFVFDSKNFKEFLLQSLSSSESVGNGLKAGWIEIGEFFGGKRSFSLLLLEICNCGASTVNDVPGLAMDTNLSICKVPGTSTEANKIVED